MRTRFSLGAIAILPVFALVLPAVGLASACPAILANRSHQELESELSSRSEASILLLERAQGSLDPKAGNGAIETDANFDSAYLSSLFDMLSRERNLFLWRDGVRNTDDITKRLNLDRQVFAPIIDYIEQLTVLLNEVWATPRERRKIRIELVRMAFSDGADLVENEQINFRPHIDTFRYLTGAVNLGGAGMRMAQGETIATSKLDQFSLRYLIESTQHGELSNFTALPEGRAMIFNGLLRSLMIPGKGSEPTLHGAPDGRKERRMGLVLFWTLDGMNSPVAVRAISAAKTISDRQKVLKDLDQRYLHPARPWWKFLTSPFGERR